MKRVVAIVALLVILPALTGCGKSLSERVQEKELCDKAGGVYKDYQDGFGDIQAYCLIGENGEEK